MKTNISLFLSIVAILLIMADYTQIGYDEFLNKVPPPSQGKVLELAPLESAQISDSFQGDQVITTIQGTLVGSGVNADNITTGQMSFDRARGGSLILGGLNNQNGIFSLRDDEDSERLSMNKDGMIINKGALTIKDQTNQTIVDSQGLVSNSNFTADGISILLPSDLTSGTYTDISGTSINIILTRPTKLIFFFTVEAVGVNMVDTNPIDILYRIVIDGSNSGNVVAFNDVRLYTPGYTGSTQTRVFTMSTQQIATLKAGAHNIKIQGKILKVNSERAQTNALSLFYIKLGS